MVTKIRFDRFNDNSIIYSISFSNSQLCYPKVMTTITSYTTQMDGKVRLEPAMFNIAIQ